MLIDFRKWKRSFFKVFMPFVALVIKGVMSILIKTCTVKIEGLEQFCITASKEKSMLMFWHNRLIIIPFILSKYAPDLLFAGLVSNHGDGKILSSVIQSFQNGRIIECSQKDGYNAIREIISRLNKEQLIVIITPDGPRGPLHEIKSGIAAVALKTHANVFPLKWEASRFWEFNTWDKQRIPKPFSTIHITIGAPVSFASHSSATLEEAKQLLKEVLL